MLKPLHAPHLGRTVKLGRRRPVALGPRLRLSRYLDIALPPGPAAVDYSAKAASVLADIYGNDSLGDCVIAGAYHIVGVETGNAGALYTATEQQIEHDYSAIGGYVPGDDSTDNGCEMQTALNYWMAHGFANGTKPLGWLAVDATNKAEMMSALYLFEHLYIGAELPDQWVNPFPSGPGFVWDAAGASDPNNGHAVMACGYGPLGVKIDTWGMLGTMTWAALAAYCVAPAGGELYVLLTLDQLARGQMRAPNGVAWADLIRDFDLIGGHVPIPVPPPPPPPPPPPAPHPAPAPKTLTLAQAQAVLAKGWPV